MDWMHLAKFLWALVSRAFWQAFDLVGGTPGVVLVWFVGAVVTGVLVFSFRGREAFMEHLKANVVIVIAGAVCTWLLVFTWKLAWLPHDIRQESDKIQSPGPVSQRLRPQLPLFALDKTPALPRLQGPPFSVSVEWAMFSIGGKGYGTSLWTYYPSQGGCGISPIQAVFFIRVKNLRNTPVTVIGYKLDVLGTPLMRTNMGSIVWILQKGSSAPRRRSGDPINADINFGQGPGFSMVQFPLNETDFTRGALLKMDLIENLLKSPLQPNVPIRGWAFYQSPNADAFTVGGPGHITLEAIAQPSVRRS